MAPQESLAQAELGHSENLGQLLQRLVMIALHLTDERNCSELLNLHGNRRIASALSELLQSNHRTSTATEYWAALAASLWNLDRHAHWMTLPDEMIQQEAGLECSVRSVMDHTRR